MIIIHPNSFMWFCKRGINISIILWRREHNLITDISDIYQFRSVWNRMTSTSKNCTGPIILKPHSMCVNGCIVHRIKHFTLLSILCYWFFYLYTLYLPWVAFVWIPTWIWLASMFSIPSLKVCKWSLQTLGTQLH